MVEEDPIDSSLINLEDFENAKMSEVNQTNEILFILNYQLPSIYDWQVIWVTLFFGNFGAKLKIKILSQNIF